ncbi:MAG: hypothetical protein K2X36_08165, partial [Microbacteriaceae bacterium]|nr:hypothetical protein [Microbacteriaceae bacterium]
MREPWSLPLFASVVSLAFVLVAITDQSPAMAIEVSAPAPQRNPQVFAATDDYVSVIELAEWKTSKIVTYGTAPAAGTPD